MRWDNLKMTTEEEERLPGYSDPAVVRHFDAPEAMGVNFYEVRAKSALNRVPEISQVPFRWTINPYRGCTHACTFCFARPTHEFLGMNAGEDFETKMQQHDATGWMPCSELVEPRHRPVRPR